MAKLGRVYATILCIGGAFLAAQILWRRLSAVERVFEHTFSVEKVLFVPPDAVILTLKRREPWAEKASVVFGQLKASTEQLSKAHQGAEAEESISVATEVLSSSKGVARAIRGTASVSAPLSPAKILPIIEQALASGMNVVEDARVSLTESARLRVVAAADAEAKAEAMEHADSLAKVMHLRVMDCEKPGFGIGIGSGESMGAGGSTGTVAPPDLVPIDELLRPLPDLVLPEPEFSGPVEVAKTLALKPLAVTGSATIHCTFVPL